MGQRKIDDQRLLKEAEQAVLQLHTRRHFLKESAMGLGALAMGSLLGACGSKPAGNDIVFDPVHPLMPKFPHFPGRAKSVIYLHMAGAPSQLELFDYKPELMNMDGQDCPQSLLDGKRFAFIRGVPKMLVHRRNFPSMVKAGPG